MIKFFNKIRKNLLSESKFSKYLLYAIGEIILVVIGILLAVQINEWNEERKTAKASRIHLEKMIVELETTKARMAHLTTNKSGAYSFGYACLSEAVASSDSLLELSYIGFSEKDIPFITTCQFIAGTSSLNIQQDVFEEVKNAGGLNSLGSEELVTAIKSFNTRVIRETGYTVEINEGVQELRRNLKKGLGKLRQDHLLHPEQFQISDYPWFFERQSREYQDMQTSLYNLKRWQAENMEKMLVISDLSDSLIVQIQDELSNRGR